MDIVEEILKNKRYRERIDRLSKEALILIAHDPIKALEAAEKGIKQIEPERADDVEYLQTLANALQQLAKRLLEEGIKNKNIL